MFVKRSEQITLAGSILLAVGVFLPMVNIGGLGTVSYADATDPEVYLLVVAALASSGMIAASKQRLAIVPMLISWLVLLWPMLKNVGGGNEDGGLLGKVARTVSDPLQELAGRLFSNVFDFEWGGYVFLLGLVLLTIGSVKVFLENR